MKKAFLSLSLLIAAPLCARVADNPNVYKIDSIMVVIPSADGNEVITESEKNRPAIDGTMRTEDDLIRGARFFLEAKKYGMTPTEADIDSHLNMIKRENNITHDQIVELFDSAGYTYQEGREQLGKMSSASTLLSVRVQSRLLIPEREVRAYYNEHPEYIQAAYHLQHGVMPFLDDMDKEKQRKRIEATLRANKPIPLIEWGDPFWVEDEDLAEDKQFLKQMKPNEIRLAQELSNGFELFKMHDVREKRLLSFEERYTEIADILRRPRYERLFSEFEEQLKATMPVIDLRTQ